jgi:HSP20 family molecular chaperone IbpA
MHSELIQVMHDQASAIYWALTGDDVPQNELSARTTEEGATAETVEPDEAIEAGALEEVARKFVELEALARSLPELAEHVPPFSFTPAWNLIEEPEALLIQIALPGIDRSQIIVEREGDTLHIAGSGRGPLPHCKYLHAGIPRGPFYRAIALPFTVAGEPQVSLDQGVLEIRCSKAPAA